MAGSPIGTLLQHVRTLLAQREPGSDAQLVDRFIQQGDEKAFAALMQRHAPLVLGVCRRVLQHEQDAEDVFQATFLVLARRASAIRRRTSLASWLYGVAYRLALKARAAAAKRSLHEQQFVPRPARDALADVTWGELRQILDEELARLPEKVRAPLLLCYFNGQTQDEASRLLGCKARTFKARLARARALLRKRLERRGLTLSTVLTGPLLSQNVDPASSMLCQSTAQAARLFAAREALDGAASARVMALAEGGLRTMLITKVLVASASFSAAIVVTGGVVLLGSRPAPAPVQVAPRPLAQGTKPSTVDRWGDALPAGAISRLGTIRFRFGGIVLPGLGFLADGKIVVTAVGDGTIQYWEATTGKLLRVIDPSPLSVRGFGVSPDGKYFAVGGFLPHQENLRPPGAVGIWDCSSGRQVRLLQRTDRDVDSCSLAFTPDHKFLGSIGDSGILRIEEVETGLEIVRHQFPRDIGPILALSPDGAMVAVSTGLNTRKLYLWRWQAAEEPRELKVSGHVGRVLTFSPDGTKLAESGNQVNRSARIWDVATGLVLQKLDPLEPDHHSTSYALFSPDGKRLIASTRSDMTAAIEYWDVATGEHLSRLNTVPMPIGRMAIAADGKLLAFATGNRVRVWDLSSGKEIATTEKAHEKPPERIVVTPTGLIATASHDFTIRLWEPATGEQRLKLQHGFYVCDIAVSPDGTKLVSSSLDDTVCLWDLSTGEKIHQVSGHGHFGGRGTVGFTQDGKYFLSWGDDMYLRKWKVSTGKLVLEHRPLPEGLSLPDDRGDSSRRERTKRQFIHNLGTGAFSPDGTTFVLTLGSQHHIFDVATGKQSSAFAHEAARVSSLAVSPDGKLLLMSAWGNPVATKLTDGSTRFSLEESCLVSLRELATGKVIQRIILPAGGAGPLPVAFSADGRLMAVATPNPNCIRVWDVASGKETRIIDGFHDWVHSLAFLPDGKGLVSGMDDTSALVWDLTKKPR